MSPITNEFIKSKFPPHGKQSYRIRNGIIYTDIIGPLNIEFIQAYQAMWLDFLKYNQHMLKLPVLPILTTWHESMMTDPDTIKLLTKNVLVGSMDRFPNQKHIWIVSKEVEGRSIMLPIWERMYKENNIPWYSVETKEDALLLIK